MPGAAKDVIVQHVRPRRPAGQAVLRVHHGATRTVHDLARGTGDVEAVSRGQLQSGSRPDPMCASYAGRPE
jgi:hypothetical protein